MLFIYYKYNKFDNFEYFKSLPSKVLSKTRNSIKLKCILEARRLILSIECISMLYITTATFLLTYTIKIFEWYEKNERNSVNILNEYQFKEKLSIEANITNRYKLFHHFQTDPKAFIVSTFDCAMIEWLNLLGKCFCVSIEVSSLLEVGVNLIDYINSTFTTLLTELFSFQQCFTFSPFALSMPLDENI